MSERAAVLALHYQNEVLHPDGKIRVGVNDEKVRESVIEGARRLLAFARKKQLPLLHVRIAFRPDYADCPRNTPIFQKTIELGAVKDGEWGAEFMKPLQPLENEQFVCRYFFRQYLAHARCAAFDCGWRGHSFCS